MKLTDLQPLQMKLLKQKISYLPIAAHSQIIFKTFIIIKKYL
jgi:hypothetical protein